MKNWIIGAVLFFIPALVIGQNTKTVESVPTDTTKKPVKKYKVIRVNPDMLKPVGEPNPKKKKVIPSENNDEGTKDD